MKKIILIISFLFVLACSTGSDETEINNEDGFLTKYEGVVWMDSKSSNNNGWWLIFSPNGAREGNKSGTYCYTEFIPWNIEKNEITYKILSNTPSSLKIEAIDESEVENESFTLTITVSGNTASFLFSDEPDEPYTFYIYDSDAPC